MNLPVNPEPAAPAAPAAADRTWIIIALLALVGVARSVALLRINAAEYTDGILVIGRNLFGPTYWPPGYTWTSMAASWVTAGDLEAGARLVSALCGGLTIIPVAWLAAWLAGPLALQARREQLAALAGLFYLASPDAWRWSLRVMTDSQFTLLMWTSLALTAAAWSAFTERASARRDLATNASTNWAPALLPLAVLAGLAAGFTRNQGIFLIPVHAGLVLAVGWLWWRGRCAVPRAMAAGLLAPLAWLMWPLLMGGQVQAHGGQVAFRAAMAGAAEDATSWEVLIASGLQMLAMLEAFVYLTPYFFTPLVVVFAVVGAVTLHARRPRQAVFLLTGGLLVLLILTSQAAFQSFLSRYLLPLVPLVSILAAWGVATLMRRKPRATAVVAGLAIIWGLAFGLTSIILQRGAFGDIRQAALALADVAPLNAAVYANETYKPEAGLGAIKLIYWSGRRVEPLALMPTPPPPGSFVVLSSAYGGPEAYARTLELLTRQMGGEVVAGPFDSWLVPLLPDIMQSPQFGHQSPMAWIYRYLPQQFRSVVLHFPARAR